MKKNKKQVVNLLRTSMHSVYHGEKILNKEDAKQLKILTGYYDYLGPYNVLEKLYELKKELSIKNRSEGLYIVETIHKNEEAIYFKNGKWYSSDYKNGTKTPIKYACIHKNKYLLEDIIHCNLCREKNKNYKDIILSGSALYHYFKFNKGIEINLYNKE